MKKYFHARISPEERRMLDEIKKETGMTESAIVRLAIRRVQEELIQKQNFGMFGITGKHRHGILITFDSDFEVYRWDKNKKFEVLK